MKLKCIAIDDEVPALEKMRTYIDRIPYLELISACDSAIDAKAIIEERKDIDAVFVDINMPDMNGLDFVSDLDSPSPMVVFITAYPEYAIDSYRTGAVDYLLKPYGFEDFCRAAGRLVERSDSPTNTSDLNSRGTEKSFFIKIDSRWVKLEASEIEYIRGYGDYLRVYVSNRTNPYVTYSTLSAVRDMLPDSFLQVHRSYIVNMEEGVSAVERARILTKSKQEIPVGETFRDAVADYLAERSIGKDSRKRTD